MLNKMQRKLLIEARKLIAEGREGYVCIAIKTVARGLPASYERHSDSLCSYIHRALNEGGSHYPISTLDDWQWRRNIRHTYSGKRRDRLKWIDWMLGEGVDAAH